MFTFNKGSFTVVLWHFTIVLFHLLLWTLTTHSVVISHCQVYILFLTTTRLCLYLLLLPSARWSLMLKQVTLDHSDIVLNICNVIDDQRLCSISLHLLKLLLHLGNSIANCRLFIMWDYIVVLFLCLRCRKTTFEFVFDCWGRFTRSLDLMNVLAYEVFWHCESDSSLFYLFTVWPIIQYKLKWYNN